MTSIAFIGVGRMGAGMARRLIEHGHSVTVFDPSPEATRSLSERGAAVATTPGKACSNAEVVMLSLPNPEIVRNVVFGSDGILSAEVPPKIVIDFSTIDPSTARDLSEGLVANGVRFLDTPVSGGVIAAAEGNLLVMAGGSESDLESVRSLLNILAAKVVHCGPVGTGQSVKLSHNMLTAINTLAAGEILTASAAAGTDLNVLVDIFSEGLAGSKILAHFDRTLFTKDRPHLFAIDLMHKDISLYLDEFKDAVLPLAQLTKQSYNAARAQGLGKKDSTSVNEIYEGYYGVSLQNGE